MCYFGKTDLIFDINLLYFGQNVLENFERFNMLLLDYFCHYVKFYYCVKGPVCRSDSLQFSLILFKSWSAKKLWLRHNLQKFKGFANDE